MEWLLWALAILFALFGVACLALVAVGLPGIWLLLIAAGVIELVDAPVLGRGGPGAVSTFGPVVLLSCLGLAVLGEVFEFLSGAAGARLGGSTRRGMWGALLGGLLGAIVLTPIIPIPLLGTLLGALAGTFVGAWVAEATGPQAHAERDTVRAALAAVVGRLGGILAKLAAGVVVWMLLVRAVLEI